MKLHDLCRLGFAAPLLLTSPFASPGEASCTGAPALEAQAPKAGDSEQRELKRILHFKDGRVLRSKTRFVDGRWQYYSNREWSDIPAGLVESYTLEKDVLREAREREKQLADDDVDARVSYAAWLHASGLLEESLAELDRVLDTAPHHRGALEVLRAKAFVTVPSLAVPEDQIDAAALQLFEWALNRPRATQELAIIEFARIREREGFASDVGKALNSYSIQRRLFATRLLARLFPGQDVKRMLVHALLDGSAEVRRGASEALGATGEPAVTLPIIRALETSPSSRIRTQAAEALGYMNFSAAVPALVARLAAPAQSSGGGRLPHANIFVGRQFAYIQDFDVEVAQFQSIADPQINVLIEGSVLDAAVVSAREEVTSVEASAVRRSLKHLTGADPGNTKRAWIEWWEENQAGWSEEQPARPSSGPQ